MDGVQHRDTLRPNVQRSKMALEGLWSGWESWKLHHVGQCWQWVWRLEVGGPYPFSHPRITIQFSGPCGLLRPGPHLLLSHVSLETRAPLGPPDCSHHFRPRYRCRSSLGEGAGDQLGSGEGLRGRSRHQHAMGDVGEGAVPGVFKEQGQGRWVS